MRTENNNQYVYNTSVEDSSKFPTRDGSMTKNGLEVTRDSLPRIFIPGTDARKRLHHFFAFEAITSMPPIKGLRGSGITTDPSAC